jgi:hypothetical protein
MNATHSTASAKKMQRAVSHVALNYRNAEDAPLAARLLEILGFAVVQDIPLPQGGRFYQYLLDGDCASKAEGIFYMSPLPEADRALFAEIHAKLDIGGPNEHPSVAAFRAAQASDPEYGFHVGILVDSLEWIEDTMLQLRELSEKDPQFKGRIKLLCNRSRRGNPDVDSRLDASPLFGGTPRETYGRNAVQAFIETDIFSSGPFGDRLVIELDYIFPGYPNNMFTSTEL